MYQGNCCGSLVEKLHARQLPVTVDLFPTRTRG